MGIRDDEGQPPRAYYRDRVDDRLVAELLGVCKGLVCDGVVTEGEVLGLKRWIQGHSDIAVQYPCNAVVDRLQRILADGIIEPGERVELLELLQDLTGETAEQDQPMNLSTRIAYDDPLPTVFFDGHLFCFTGRLLYCTRREAERQVEHRGGRVIAAPTAKLNYLVVGPIASRAWLHSTHGAKILEAAEMRDRRLTRGEKGPAIIPEEHWILAIEQG